MEPWEALNAGLKMIEKAMQPEPKWRSCVACDARFEQRTGKDFDGRWPLLNDFCESCLAELHERLHQRKP